MGCGRVLKRAFSVGALPKRMLSRWFSPRWQQGARLPLEMLLKNSLKIIGRNRTLNSGVTFNESLAWCGSSAALALKLGIIYASGPVAGLVL